MASVGSNYVPKVALSPKEINRNHSGMAMYQQLPMANGFVLQETDSMLQ
jgi:hypothetical protein